MRYLKLLLLFVCYLSYTPFIEAQGPNSSGEYYKAADGKKGAELKTALCGVIYNREEGGDLSTAYKALWTHFQVTDARPNGTVWDMYSNKREMTFGVDQDSGSGKEEGQYYNREHSFPNSWFGSKVMPMYTDLHHMYPTDKIVNNKRSNFPFGETNGESYKSANDFSKLGKCTVEGYTGTVFEPNDEYKGDFARTYFYMVTCYEEQIPTWYTNFSDSQPTLDGKTYPGLSEWQLKMLMKWAKNDPVSEKEINRNNAVYGIQKNRNPFIDYPGLEEYIWGDKKDVAFSYDNYSTINNGNTGEEPNDTTYVMLDFNKNPWNYPVREVTSGWAPDYKDHSDGAILSETDFSWPIAEGSSEKVKVTLNVDLEEIQQNKVPVYASCELDDAEAATLKVPSGRTKMLYTQTGASMRFEAPAGYKFGKILFYTYRNPNILVGEEYDEEYGYEYNGTTYKHNLKVWTPASPKKNSYGNNVWEGDAKNILFNYPYFSAVFVKVDMRLVKDSEATPPTTHTLNLSATGNGSATYNGTTIREKTQAFTVNDGSSASITFSPDAGYRIASVKVNGTDVTSSIANNKYTISNISANTTLAVTFEAIPSTGYTLNITASGNGYVAYDGNTVRGKTSSFSVEEGTNAILKFSADEGNRLKSVKVNGQDVTSTIVNNQYTINNITANTTVEVIFEAIPDYTLNIMASGNGSAIYNGKAIRNQSQNFTLREGSSAVITITADTGYRIKSVKVNDADVTSQVANGQITISNITQDINVEVSFEAIPVTTYSLTITATGNGAVTYDGKSVRGGMQAFTVVEGAYATVQITADDGYRLKQVTLDGKDVTTDVVNNQYTTTKIMANTTLAVEFEAIPTFSLTIKSSAFGSVKYGDAVITNQTETFTVREGTEAVLTFVPDGNGRLRHVTLNGGDITNELKNGQYTISDIRADQSVEAEYVEDITKVTDAGVAYTVTSYDEGTVIVAAGNYGQVLTIPASFTANGKTWTVTGIDCNALADATELAAVIWEPEIAFTAQVSNPNLLLYVKSAEYASSEIQNVVVNDQAENIILTEAASGNNFYCPKTFTAKRISYEHNYSMISGYSTCQGWETLVLPFDVTLTISAKGTELIPHSTWEYGSNLRPFWLYQLTEKGWQAADGIKANVPYIISMPNNEMYESSYNQTGNIQFIGNNVQVMASDKMTTGQNGNKRFVANYQNRAASTGIYALNVSNEWCQNTAAEKEGSTFIRSLRDIHPFEAYLTVEGSNAVALIPIFDNTTDVRWLMEEVRGTMAENAWYDLQGRKLQGEPKQNGIYIFKGKKVKK